MKTGIALVELLEKVKRSSNPFQLSIELKEKIK